METEYPKIKNGSVKQIAWAEKIRKNMIGKLTKWISLDPKNENCTMWRELLESYQTETDAQWFIDWRNGVYVGARGCQNYL